MTSADVSATGAGETRPGRFRLPPAAVAAHTWVRKAHRFVLMTETDLKLRTRAEPKTERPKLHKVILVNDDFTPREFVVRVLKAEFRVSADQAYKIMITAHRRGVCVVAVFTKDVAETKATRATDAGKAAGYPLLFTTEPEE